MLINFLFILILSMIFTGILFIPFINFLYSIGFKRRWEGKKHVKQSFFREYHGWKVGTPVGGGILILMAIFVFSLIYYAVTSFSVNWTTITLFLTLLLFGSLGFYDDLIKNILFKRTRFWGLRLRHKLLLQILSAMVISYLLYFFVNVTSLYIPWYPEGLRMALSPVQGILLYTFVIVGAVNAFNITDGLDGLLAGLTLIYGVFLWVVVNYLGIPGEVGLFLAVTIGALIPFLYFNIYPARLWMGDTGSLSLGGLIAVMFIISDALFAFPFVVAVPVMIAFSSLFQMFTRKFLLKKYLKIAPMHFHFQAIGWDETKVVMRFWLFGVVTGLFGLIIALLGR